MYASMAASRLCPDVNSSDLVSGADLVSGMVSKDGCSSDTPSSVAKCCRMDESWVLAEGRVSLEIVCTVLVSPAACGRGATGVTGIGSSNSLMFGSGTSGLSLTQVDVLRSKATPPGETHELEGADLGVPGAVVCSSRLAPEGFEGTENFNLLLWADAFGKHHCFRSMISPF